MADDLPEPETDATQSVIGHRANIVAGSVMVWLILLAVLLYRIVEGLVATTAIIENWATVFVALVLQVIPFLFLGVLLPSEPSEARGSMLNEHPLNSARTRVDPRDGAWAAPRRCGLMTVRDGVARRAVSPSWSAARPVWPAPPTASDAAWRGVRARDGML